MAIFTINGREADSLTDAFDICRQVWSEAKAPAVMEQKRSALSKVTPLDRERAELGVVPDLAGTNRGRAGNLGAVVGEADARGKNG